MKKSLLNRSLPYIVAIVSFLAITLVYFAPQFEGKKIEMHDVTQYEGMAKDMQDEREQLGENSYWAGRMFGGMPSYLIYASYKEQFLPRTINKVTQPLGYPASLILLAMASFFVMLLLCGVNPWVGIVPSLAYGLSSYFFIIIGAGHITKLVALAYVPLVLGGVFYTMRRNMWLGAAFTALAATLQIAAGHPQITYYFGFVVAAFWISELVAAFKAKTLPRFAKATGLLGVAAMLALGANFVTLYNVQKHSKHTMRGGSELTIPAPGKKEAPTERGNGLELQYATQWSYGKMESFNMFIPDLMGGASSGGFADDGPVARSLIKYNARSAVKQLPSYWGDQPITSGPTYIGAVVIFLCVMGLFVLSGRAKWWVVAVSVLAIMLAWGSNFMWFTELFFNYFPGYNKFRTVAMILVIAEWSVPFLAAMLLWKLWQHKVSRPQFIRALKYSLYITGGVALFFLIFGRSMFDFASPIDSQMGLPADVQQAMMEERAKMLTGDAFRALIYVLLTAGAVLLYGLDKIKRGVLIAVLGVLVVADLVTVNLRYLPQSRFVEPRNTEIRPTAADLEILKDTTLGYRVANFSVGTFSDATTSYFHRSVGGYHGAKLQRYQDLIDHHLSQSNMEVYNMLNTKYFIIADKESGAPTPQYNADANGAAWYVEKLTFVDNPDAEITALRGVETKYEAVADRRFEPVVAAAGIDLNNLGLDTAEMVAAIHPDSLNLVTLVAYKSNYQKYATVASKPKIAVFSEIYFADGWQAYIDGAPADHFRVDYVLRAMVIPEGKHTVEFRFEPPQLAKTSSITLVSSVIIVVWVLGALGFAIYRRGREKNKE